MFTWLSGHDAPNIAIRTWLSTNLTPWDSFIQSSFQYVRKSSTFEDSRSLLIWFPSVIKLLRSKFSSHSRRFLNQNFWHTFAVIIRRQIRVPGNGIWISQLLRTSLAQRWSKRTLMFSIVCCNIVRLFKLKCIESILLIHTMDPMDHVVQRKCSNHLLWNRIQIGSRPDA